MYEIWGHRTIGQSTCLQANPSRLEVRLVQLKFRTIVYVIALVFPIGLYVISEFRYLDSLIWIALDTVYHYPAKVAVPSFFTEGEMGLILPSLAGRVLAVCFYSLVIFLLFLVNDKVK
jgi:hypothetical protein